jgi:two-component system sensor histidine kinase UhpB
MRLRDVSLYWRIFAINAALLGAATVALAISPATVSSDLLLREVLVLAVGVALVLLLNLVLLRRTLDPLERLTALMHRVDPGEPGMRLPPAGGGPEVRELATAFNQMLERLEYERRASGRRAIEAQEQERRRVALELHDEVGQLLTGVVLGLGSLAVPEPAEARVAELQRLVRDGADRVREIAAGLRPQSLEELGLRSALVSLTASVADGSGVAITRRLGPALPALEPATELVVYRVAQESLTNVVRHAGARTALVALDSRDGVLELQVCDDGRGLPVTVDDSGRGIAGMRERALYAGGTLDLRAQPGGGTSVTLRIPVVAP